MSRESLSNLAEKFAAIRRNQGLAEQTVDIQRHAHLRFARWFDQQRRSPRNLSEQDLEQYLYGPDGRASQVGASSFNTELTQLRMFLTWLTRREGVKPVVLDALVRKPVGDRKFHRASRAQVKQMVVGCDDPWERWTLALASQTLARDSELRSLRFEDFQLPKLPLYRQKTRTHDGMPKTAALEEELRRWKLYLQEVAGPIQGPWYTIPRRVATHLGNGATKWSYQPERPRAKVLSTVIQAHASRALGVSVDALKGEGVHLIRRSMARALFNQLANDGVADPLEVVQAMLGHKDRRTTEKYIGLEHGRERRDQLLTGSYLLWEPDENVIQLRREA